MSIAPHIKSSLELPNMVVYMYLEDLTADNLFVHSLRCAMDVTRRDGWLFATCQYDSQRNEDASAKHERKYGNFENARHDGGKHVISPGHETECQPQLIWHISGRSRALRGFPSSFCAVTLSQTLPSAALTSTRPVRHGSSY